MSRKRFDLPDNFGATSAIDNTRRNTTGALDLAYEKTRQSEINRDVSFSNDRAQIATEAIGLLRDITGVFASYAKLGETRAEWEGRVRVAQEAVKKAEVDLKEAREKNALAHRGMDSMEQALDIIYAQLNKICYELDPSKINDEKQRTLYSQMDSFLMRVVEISQSFRAVSKT